MVNFKIPLRVREMWVQRHFWKCCSSTPVISVFKVNDRLPIAKKKSYREMERSIVFVSAISFAVRVYFLDN